MERPGGDLGAGLGPRTGRSAENNDGAGTQGGSKDDVERTRFLLRPDCSPTLPFTPKSSLFARDGLKLR